MYMNYRDAIASPVKIIKALVIVSCVTLKTAVEQTLRATVEQFVRLL